MYTLAPFAATFLPSIFSRTGEVAKKLRNVIQANWIKKQTVMNATTARRALCPVPLCFKCVINEVTHMCITICTSFNISACLLD